MEEDTDYNWNTNTWIQNSRDKPTWQMWSNEMSSGNMNQKTYTSSISFSENSNILPMPLSIHSVTSSLLVLPPPPVRICKNSFGQEQHLILSLLAHLLIWIFRSGMNRIRSILRQRKQTLLEKKWGHLSISLSEDDENQSRGGKNTSSKNGNNTISTSPDINNLVRQHASMRDYSSHYCDIDDEDEYQINATAVLQHYVIVWASILTSPKGLQLDTWLMVMAIMDLAPFAWCLFMTLRFSIIQRRQSSSLEDSNDSDVSPSNHSTLLGTMPHTLMETAELLSLTMKKWSPAYQLNEMIMRRVDGCIFGHASCLYLLTFSITQIHTSLVLKLHCRSYNA